MKINPDFSELEKLVKKMGAEKQYAKIKKELADKKKKLDKLEKLKIKKLQTQLEAKNLSKKKGEVPKNKGDWKPVLRNQARASNRDIAAGRLGTKLRNLMINLKGRPRGK